MIIKIGDINIIDTIIAYFVPASLLLALGVIIFVAGKLILLGTRAAAGAIESGPFMFAFTKWFFAVKEKIPISADMKRRFLSDEEWEMVCSLQEAVNLLGEDELPVEEMKYSELEDPLFIWHNEVFCRSNTNDIINLETGQAGKIDKDEIVTSLCISRDFVQLTAILHMNRKMQDVFAEMGYEIDNTPVPF